MSHEVFKVFTIGLYACLLAFCELLEGLVITATCPLVNCGHALSLANRYLHQPGVRPLIQWHQHGDKFVAQYLISIVCAGVRANYCFCFEFLLTHRLHSHFFTYDTFPIVTALTKCSLLTNISK